MNRELKVFRLVGQWLHHSGHTVEAHRQSIRRELHLPTAGELNRDAAQWLLERG